MALPPMTSEPLIVPALAPVPTVTWAVMAALGHGGAAPVRGDGAVTPPAMGPVQEAVQMVVKALPGAKAKTKGSRLKPGTNNEDFRMIVFGSANVKPMAALQPSCIKNPAQPAFP